MRPHDITDIVNIQLTDDDIKSLYGKFDDISIENPGQALIMEGTFKTIRPKFYKNHLVDEYDVAKYAKFRYGISSDELQLNMWKRDLAQAHNIDAKNKIMGNIIGNIDVNAGLEIKNGNTKYVKNDKAYRQHLPGGDCLSS
jgi:hypothetical protein